MKIFFLPLNTGYSSEEIPTKEAIDFYLARSGNGLYCAIVGNVITPNGFGSNDVCMRISRRPEWRDLAAAISSRGALPGIQLATAWPNYIGNRKFTTRSRDESVVAYRQAVENISTEDLSLIFDDLKVATEHAICSGFSHLQLHAAHGYLFSLLIDPAVSKLVDKCLENISNWIGLVRESGVESSVRLSMNAGHSAFDMGGRREIIDDLISIGPDYVDLSNGYYNFDKHLIYPSGAKSLLERREDSLSFVNAFPAQKFIVSGREDLGGYALPVNASIGICRDLIANPDFLRGGATGCRNRMKCHFYSRGKKSLACGEWPSSSFEVNT